MDDSKTASQFVKIEEIRGVVHFVLNLPQRWRKLYLLVIRPKKMKS
jgi:hypothetical protein